MIVKSSSEDSSFNFNLSDIMQYINPQRTREWVTLANQSYFYPKTVLSKCPHCGENASFDTSGHQFHTETKTLMMGGKCNVCSEKVKLYGIGYKSKGQNGGELCDEIWMLPKPSVRELKFQATSIPEDIFDAYETAVKSFNAGIWRSVVTECGRALEGVTQEKFKTKEQRQEIKNVTNNINKNEESNVNALVKSILFKPVLELSSAIRLGRLTGAHFNIKGKATKEVAERVLELTEYLLRYFFVLPSDASELEKIINELGDTGLDEE